MTNLVTRRGTYSDLSIEVKKGLKKSHVNFFKVYKCGLKPETLHLVMNKATRNLHSNVVFAQTDFFFIHPNIK